MLKVSPLIFESLFFFWISLLFFHLQRIPCFFECFPPLSQSSNPCFWGFPCCFHLQQIPCFLSVFLLFPRNFRDSEERKILVFLVVFLAFLPKKQRKEDQGPGDSLQSPSCVPVQSILRNSNINASVLMCLKYSELHLSR